MRHGSPHVIPCLISHSRLIYPHPTHPFVPGLHAVLDSPTEKFLHSIQSLSAVQKAVELPTRHEQQSQNAVAKVGLRQNGVSPGAHSPQRSREPATGSRCAEPWSRCRRLETLARDSSYMIPVGAEPQLQLDLQQGPAAPPSSATPQRLR